MREVTIKVFSFDELEDKARDEARYYLLNRTYDIEEAFARESLSDMIKYIIDDYIYQVPKGIPDIDCFSLKFSGILESKGIKIIKGKDLVDLYTEYLQSCLENFDPAEEYLSEYAREANIEFFSNGEVYKEN